MVASVPTENRRARWPISLMAVLLVVLFQDLLVNIQARPHHIRLAFLVLIVCQHSMLADTFQRTGTEKGVDIGMQYVRV